MQYDFAQHNCSLEGTMNRRTIGVCNLCLLVASCLPGFSQTFYGSIVGTVRDPSGGIVPGAAVVLTNTGTSEKRASETDASGNYQFVNLVPGTYRVDIQGSGFKHLTRDGIQVEV